MQILRKNITRYFYIVLFGKVRVYKDKMTDRKVDKENDTDRQIGRYIKETDRQKGKYTKRKIYKDKEVDIQRDRYTKIQIDKETYLQRENWKTERGREMDRQKA